MQAPITSLSYLDIINVFLKNNIGRYVNDFCETLQPSGHTITNEIDGKYITFHFATPHSIASTTYPLIVFGGKLQNQITDVSIDGNKIQIKTERVHQYANIDLRNNVKVEFAGFIPTDWNGVYDVIDIETNDTIILKFNGATLPITQNGFLRENDINLVNGTKAFTIQSPTSLKYKLESNIYPDNYIDNYFFDNVLINTGIRINVALNTEEIVERYQVSREAEDQSIKPHLFIVYQGENYIDKNGGSLTNSPENKNTATYINQKLINFSIFCIKSTVGERYGVQAQRFMLNFGVVLNSMLKALSINTAFIKSRASIYATGQTTVDYTKAYLLHRYDYSFNVYENSYQNILNDLHVVVPYNEFNMDFDNGMKIINLEIPQNNT